LRVTRRGGMRVESAAGAGAEVGATKKLYDTGGDLALLVSTSCIWLHSGIPLTRSRDG